CWEILFTRGIKYAGCSLPKGRERIKASQGRCARTGGADIPVCPHGKADKNCDEVGQCLGRQSRRPTCERGKRGNKTAKPSGVMGRVTWLGFAGSLDAPAAFWTIVGQASV